MDGAPCSDVTDALAAAARPIFGSKLRAGCVLPSDDGAAEARGFPALKDWAPDDGPKAQEEEVEWLHDVRDSKLALAAAAPALASKPAAAAGAAAAGVPQPPAAANAASSVRNRLKHATLAVMATIKMEKATAEAAQAALKEAAVLKREAEVSGHKLHEALKLTARDAAGRPCDLLEEFGEEALVPWLHNAIAPTVESAAAAKSSSAAGDFCRSQKLVAALYRDEHGETGEPALQVLVAIRSVGFLHELRDLVRACASPCVSPHLSLHLTHEHALSLRCCGASSKRS